MRPRGEIRAALARAARQLVPVDAPPDAGFTWRELVRRACVGELVGRRTVVDMHRAGELVLVGKRPVPGICRPANLYAPKREPTAEADALLVAMSGWRR